jgi:uncharacterized protein (TIGR02246 family)
MTSNVTSVQDGGAVRAVLEDVYTAWAAGDADAFVARYAENATAVLPGSWLQGREAIRATMADAFAGQLKGSRGVHQVQSIRFPSDGAAIVISKGGIAMAGQAEPAAETRSVDTWVLSSTDEGWQVEAFHNCQEYAG